MVVFYHQLSGRVVLNLARGFQETFYPLEHFLVRRLCLLKCVTEQKVWRFQGDGLVQCDAVLRRRDLCDVGDGRARRLICLSVDGILCDRNNVGSIFDFEFERPPFQVVGDEVTSNACRFICRPLHFFDQRVDFVMLGVVGDQGDDCLCVGENENLFFECALFHEVIILLILTCQSRF